MKKITIICFIMIFSNLVFAAQNNNLIGVWSLKKYTIEIKSNNKKIKPFGDKPEGSVIFSSLGWVSFIITKDTPSRSKLNSSDLTKTMLSYSGEYKLSSGQWTTKIKAAWNPKWVGTEQTRYYKILNDKLHVTTPWRIMPNWKKFGLTRSEIIFEKIKKNN